MMTKTVPLSSIRADDVDELLDQAFGADRHGRTAYLLRRNMPVIDHLSFAVLDDEVLVGSIQCWPVAVGNAPLILVGPVAVSPARQNQGIGRLLMHTSLDAVAADDPPMVMIGDPEYYSRFGFVADETDGWTLPGPWEPHRLLLRNPNRVKLPVTAMLGPRL
jgi:predicted N-acetyltransferase YhbS